MRDKAVWKLIRQEFDANYLEARVALHLQVVDLGASASSSLSWVQAQRHDARRGALQLLWCWARRPTSHPPSTASRVSKLQGSLLDRVHGRGNNWVSSCQQSLCIY
jgi:hypothetical protein